MRNKREIDVYSEDFDSIFDMAKEEMRNDYDWPLDDTSFDFLKAIIKNEFDYIEYDPDLDSFTLVEEDYYSSKINRIYLDLLKYYIEEMSLFDGLDNILDIVENFGIANPKSISAYDFMKSLVIVYNISLRFHEYFEDAFHEYYKDEK